MFRFFKQQPGWTRPKLRDPAAADRWTWLVVTCYAQLYLARPLAADIRLPWQQPCEPGRHTPARVRRGFRHLRQPAHSRQRAETRQAWPRTPARLEERPPRHPPRRRQKRETRRNHHEEPTGQRG